MWCGGDCGGRRILFLFLPSFCFGKIPGRCKAALHESFFVFCSRSLGSVCWRLGGGSPRVKAGQWGAYDSTMPGYVNTWAASAHPSTVSSRGRPQIVISPSFESSLFERPCLSLLTFHLYDMFLGGRLDGSHC
jgi:hypothetical protein